MGHGFDTVGVTYPNLTWKRTDQRLAAIVRLDTALLLVVLDGLVPQQADKLRTVINKSVAPAWIECFFQRQQG